MTGFKSYLDKYGLSGFQQKFIDRMDQGVAPVLATSWLTGAPVTGLLGPALNLSAGGMKLMTYLELDITAALAGIFPGTPIVPGITVPSFPKALLAVIASNPQAPENAKRFVNAILDWAVAQAPATPNPAKGPPAPWPPKFTAA